MKIFLRSLQKMFRAIPFLLFVGLFQNASFVNAADSFHGPTFALEPPSRLVLSSSNGASASCLARGSPTPHVTWVSSDGMPLLHISGLRHILENGTLVLPPFSASRYRHDVHAAAYRCRATNSVGVVVSREVRVTAVIEEPWEPLLSASQTQIGGTAVLTCAVAAPIGNYVKVTSWLKDGSLLLHTSDSGSRYVVLSAVNKLAVRSISRDDVTSSFSCDVVFVLSGERKRSKPTQIVITENIASMAPKMTTTASDIVVDRESEVHIICSAISQPPAIYSWYRESSGGQLYPVATNLHLSVNKEIIYIRRVEADDEGRWICKAYNQYGEQHQETRIIVTSPLIVNIKPKFQVANTGTTVRLTCTASGASSLSVRWLHDGLPVVGGTSIDGSSDPKAHGAEHELAIRSVARSDKGMYQCIASNGREDAQALAELRLGDIAPELLYTFIEQALRQGPAVSLKCSASGSPPPTFTWLLDGQPISDYNLGHGLVADQYVTENGDIISHLNISSVRTQDGGQYTCQAINSMGEIQHTSRLNIYGPPSIRSQSPVRSIAGSNTTIFCPYYGYPISSIRWSRRGQELKSGNRYILESDGALQIQNIDSTTDAGAYTCTVTSPDGDIVKRDIEVTIKNPPKLVPFSFPNDLGEGSSVQLLCGMTSGDRPVYFSWLKDSSPIPSSLQIQEKSLGEFSLLIFTDVSSRHSGDYTCVASNMAAKVNHTAKLMVKVTPTWLFEPQDLSIMVGTPAMVHCAAQGFPKPNLTWQKTQGSNGVEIRSIDNNDIRHMIMPNGSLYVSTATAQHEGQYMCKAENGIGTGLTKTINLRVNEPARFEETSKNLSARRNDPIVLICEVHGDQPIQIHWSHNLKNLESNSYRLSMSEVITDSGLRSQVSFGRTERQDSGVYKCQAENAFGRSEHLIYLTVQERPDAPSLIQMESSSSRYVILSWRQGFDGHSALRGYRVQYRFLGSVRNDDWHMATQYNISIDNIKSVSLRDTAGEVVNTKYEATISGLRPATAYMVRFAAYNDIDESTYSEPVVVKTQEEAPAEAPTNIQIQANSPEELVVSWKTPSHESWNGDLIGYIITWTELTPNGLPPAPNATTMMPVKGWSNGEVTLNGLKKFTRYEVRVSAFNSISAGPSSSPAFATTLEGVPQAPPTNVKCVTLSSQSIKISWDPPPGTTMGGLMQGFKVVYAPVYNENELWPSMREVKRTSGTDTYLQALKKATNHSIQVLAFTGAGDGVKSPPVYCSTEEDVPGSPSGIKAMALTTDTIVISWLPPEMRNGRILRYLVYSREAGRIGRHKQKSITIADEPYNQKIHDNTIFYTTEINALRENQLYEFWVTAITSPGEGEPSAIIAQGPNTRAIARIASFGTSVRVALGQDVRLPCTAVGKPSPHVRWTTPGIVQPRYQVEQQNTIAISYIGQNQGGNYTCSVRNSFGGDSITFNVIVVKSPAAPAPRLRTTGADRITIAWPPVFDGGAPIQGYRLFYKELLESIWNNLEISPELQSFTIEDLHCGSTYSLYLVAYNGVGKGEASEAITVSTKGGVPKSPTENEFISTNITSIKLNFFMWDNGGCIIRHFQIEYREFGATDWITETALLTVEGYHIIGLTVATWYSLRVKAKNDAGIAVGKYYFATLNSDGAKIAPPSVYPLDWDGDDLVKGQFSGMLSMVLALGVLLLFATMATVTYFLTHNKRPHLLGRVLNEFPGQDEDKTNENQENQRNYQQVYTSSPSKQDISENHGGVYDISPYATFTMPVTGSDDIGTEGGNTLLMDLEQNIQLRTFGMLEKNEKTPGKSKWTTVTKGKSRQYETDGEYNASKTSHKAGSVSSVSSKARMSSRAHMRSSNSAHLSSKMAEESDSESSESPCTQCKSKPSYRLPVNATTNDTVADSSTESSSPVELLPGRVMNAGGGRGHGDSTPRRAHSHGSDHERPNSARYSQRHDQERRDFIIHV